MTTVKVFREDGRIVRVKASGHAGYADAGNDIVCAALSAILETTLLGLERVANAKTDSVRDEKKGYLEFWFPDDRTAKERDVQTILCTMLAGITDLAEGRPRYIKSEVIEL